VKDTLQPQRFGAAGVADVHFEVPVSEISPGEYVLAIEAGVGPAVSVRRDVPFAVR
jgi:hypothetical protein